MSSSFVPQLRSLAIAAGGSPLSLRLLLPPNLAAVAARGGRIAVKVEWHAQGADMAPDKLPAGPWMPEPAVFLAALLVESWCEGRVPGMLQLDADQLLQLLQPLQGADAVFWLKEPARPIRWNGAELEGVHNHLRVAAVASPSAVRSPASARQGGGRAQPQAVLSDREAEALGRVGASGASSAAGSWGVAGGGEGAGVADLPPIEPDLMPMEVDGSPNFLALRLPSRQSALYAPALDLVKDWGFKLEPSNGKWWLRDRHKTLQFLADYSELLRSGYRARFSDNFTERTRGLQLAEAALEVQPETPRGGGNAFNVELAIRARGLDEQALQQALDKGQHYIESASAPRGADGSPAIILVPRALRECVLDVQRSLSADAAGAAVAMSRGLRARFTRRVLKEEVAVTQGVLERLRGLAAAADASASGRISGFASGAGGTPASGAVGGSAQGAAALAGGKNARHARRRSGGSADMSASVDFMADDLPLAGARLPQQWLELSRALADVSQLRSCPVPAELASRLRPYQQVGAAWLWHLFRSGLGGILADEMGLGKTVQCLAFLGAVCATGKGHGTADSDTAAPSLVVCPAALVENWRREAARFLPQLRVFCHHGSSRLPDADAAGGYDLIITSYGTLTRDQALFQQIGFGVVVGDEAQQVKNAKTRNARALRSLRSEGRFLLTGTPIENDISELQSLFDFILPGYLVPAGRSGGAHGSGSHSGGAAGGLQAGTPERTAERERLINRAAPYILRRMKQNVATELPEKIEQVIYCELEADQQAFYRSVQENARRAVMELELARAAEGQIRMAAFTELLRLRQACIDPRLVGSASAADGTGDADAISSAKREALNELLGEAVGGGHRVLVFSQFTAALRLVAEDLDRLQLSHFYLDGQTKDRAALCERFNRDASVKVFLISLRAGGTGLNLTGADTVVHLDPWWNPAAQAQATDRAHRIGQTRVVNVYQLIAAGTVEEKVLGLQRQKAELLEQLLDASDAASARIGLDDIKALID